MSFNPHEYLLPAATQFRLHPGSVAERVFRNLEARLPHRDSPRTGSLTAFFQAFTPQAPAAIASCPLDPQGESDRRNLDALFGRFSEVDFVVCARANRAQPRSHRCRVPLVWELGPDEPLTPRSLTPSQASPFAPDREQHMHAETLIDRRRVHIDFVSFATDRPGGAIDECRVFVDGRLAGRGGGCRSLIGMGGYSFPAVALVDVGLAITADVVSDEHGLIVELWDVHHDTSPTAARFGEGLDD